MRIGMNLFALTWRGGGMRQYVLQLLPALLRQSDHEFMVFTGMQGLPSLATALRGLSHPHRQRLDVVEIDDQEQVYRHAHRFDVYFCPLNGFAPRIHDRPTLGTLADIQDQFFPQYFTPEQQAVRRALYPYMARATTLLLTISEFSRNSICQAFGVPASKVRVTYLAPSDDILHARPRLPTNQPPPPEPYVFYPANLYPHKNHELLLEAMSLLRRQTGLTCHCLLTGHEVTPGINIQERIAAHGLEGIVHWLGHVPADALRYLYDHAAALAFPSQFEGFGMPLVEAMACGCPVVTTRTASIPEVAGDAALYVEASAGALASAIAGLVQGHGRQELIAQGRKRAERFTPVAMAADTLAALDEAVERFDAEGRTASAAVSYVIRPSREESALVRTLTSICHASRASDEVLVLARSDSLGPRAQLLCDNMGSVRFTERGDWPADVRNEVVYYVRAGERLLEGAPGAAAAALAENPSCRAVIGEVLNADSAGNLDGVCFAPAEPFVPALAQSLTPAAVFWRRDFLREGQQIIRRRGWARRLIQEVKPCRFCRVYRTFATADPAEVAAGAAEDVRTGGLLANYRLIKEHAPGVGAREVLWATLAPLLVRWRRSGRWLARMLPRRLEAGLRAFYARRILPHLHAR
jgi:glycosyltransferase involved in cell wall biosynthesis